MKHDSLHSGQVAVKPPPSPSALHASRDLWVIASGRSISLLGDTVATTALVLHAHSAGWGGAGVAAVIVAGSLPLVVAAPLAGRLVDRVDSRPLTLLAACWQAVCALLLGAALATGDHRPVAVAGALALLVALSAGQAVSGPAWAALIPAAVAPEAVGRALGAVQAASTVATVSGAALGGLLAGGAGAATAMVVDAASFAVLAVGALLVRARRRPQAGPPVPHASWSGATLLARDVVLGPLVGAMVVLVCCLHLVLVARVFLVRDVLHGDPTAFGLVGTAFPAGMLLGSLLGGRIGGTARRVRWSVAGFAGLAAGVLASGLAPSLAALWGAQALTGFACGIVGVLVNALILDRVPDASRGRVLAAFLGAMQACDVGGTLVGGPLTAVLGPRAIYVLAGSLGLFVVGLVAARAVIMQFRSRLRRFGAA